MYALQENYNFTKTVLHKTVCRDIVLELWPLRNALKCSGRVRPVRKGEGKIGALDEIYTLIEYNQKGLLTVCHYINFKFEHIIDIQINKETSVKSYSNKSIVGF